MHQDLLWSYEGYGRGFTSYVGPTWSWASQAFEDIEITSHLTASPKTMVVYITIYYQRETKVFDCSIRRTKVDFVTGDPYG